MDDPCPPPEKKREKQKLNEREKTLYAPMSNVGQVIYDKDAIYFEMPSKIVEKVRPGQDLLNELQEFSGTLDESITNRDLQLLSTSKAPLKQEKK